jgi:hypothetical protein
MGTTSYRFGWYLAALELFFARYPANVRVKRWVAR